MFCVSFCTHTYTNTHTHTHTHTHTPPPPPPPPHHTTPHHTTPHHTTPHHTTFFALQSPKHTLMGQTDRATRQMNCNLTWKLWLKFFVLHSAKLKCVKSISSKISDWNKIRFFFFWKRNDQVVTKKFTGTQSCISFCILCVVRRRAKNARQKSMIVHQLPSNIPLFDHLALKSQPTTALPAQTLFLSRLETLNSIITHEKREKPKICPRFAVPRFLHRKNLLMSIFSCAHCTWVNSVFSGLHCQSDHPARVTWLLVTDEQLLWGSYLCVLCIVQSLSFEFEVFSFPPLQRNLFRIVGDETFQRNVTAVLSRLVYIRTWNELVCLSR